ncbi:Dihydrolipoyl dehydrogenase [bacterium HR13]|nr:Dihydrolipoyl dehydrogenase [bacterium HR13]
MFDYDVIILGGGLAYTAAEILRNKGLKVAIVEKNKEHLGGVCLHEGCVPTKLYLFEAQKIYDMKNSRLLEWKGGDVKLKRLVEYKERLRKKLREDIERLLKGVDIIYGDGTLTDRHTVVVGERQIRGRYIIVNTGKRQTWGFGLEPDGKRVITTDEAINLESLPERLQIVGDDHIAFEFATFFAVLGSQVNLYFDNPMSFAHTSIKNRFLKELELLGIALYPIKDFKAESITLLVKRRVPNSECVGDLMQKDENNHILVDAHYETSIKDHYAVGDVNGLSETAHAARMQSLIVSKRILGERSFYIRPENIPYVLYTVPLSYAKVGLTKMELERRGIKHTEKSVSLRAFSSSYIQHSEDGMCFLYFDSRGFLMGCEVLSRGAGEIISSLTVSLYSELNISHMSKVLLPHPTLSEIPFLRLV